MRLNNAVISNGRIIGTMESNVTRTVKSDILQTEEDRQYSKAKILGLWALVALPMGIFRFVLFPFLAGRVNIHPGILYWWLMIIGMMWQFVLSMIILKKELGRITFAGLKKRLWLNPPIDQKTMKVKMKAYWLVIPIILYAFFFEQLGLFDFIEKGISSIFPILAEPASIKIESLMAPEFRDAWYILGITIISSIFNYLLGEELFFRGILLPKMNGAFGKRDWFFNGILFAAYHLHKIAEIPLFLIGSIFYSFLNKKYKSFYPGLIIHGVEGVVLLVFVLLFLTRII